MKFRFLLRLALVATFFLPILRAQQADDAQANPPAADNVELVTQVQQLRAEVERLSEQIDRLNTEVKELQGTTKAPPQRTTRSKLSAPTPGPPPVVTPAVSAQIPDSVAITVLVFRDGRHIETRNYAIVGESIWVYTEQESKKYRLADLDLDATKKLNSDRGILFDLPPAR